MHQIIETTKEEKIEMYSKLSKKQVIEMLIEANRHLSSKPTLIVDSSTMSLKDKISKFKLINLGSKCHCISSGVNCFSGNCRICGMRKS